MVWEHFSEDDDRLRSGKQLCKTAPSFEGFAGGDYGAAGNYLSQGLRGYFALSAQCIRSSQWALAHFITRRSADAGAPTSRKLRRLCRDHAVNESLRDIQSAINPTYWAKNDTLELNVDYAVAPALTFTSQTGFNRDFLWSMEDYDRFDSAQGAFVYYGPGLTLPDPAAGKNGVPANSGIFCDPQLGCSDRLVLEDLSDEHAWQLSQEFRIASNFSGPFNFSAGGNYLHYETEENYYVFINSLTALSVAAEHQHPLDPGVFPTTASAWRAA